MTPQEIILACNHPKPIGFCDVTLTDGREVQCCVECWNQSVHARQAQDKIRLEQAKQAGRDYWRKRGIEVGETVFASGMGVFGPFRVSGIAKVGRCGAYVTSSAQRGQLSPHAFSKAITASSTLERVEMVSSVIRNSRKATAQD